MSIPFGYIKESDEYVYIEDVKNGLACNCICPSCGMKLEARHGNEREHHFKHHEKAEKECTFSYWVAVRSMAKQILQKSEYIHVEISPFSYKIPFVKSPTKVEIFGKNVRGKKHGFDFELQTSIGYFYVYFVTPEDASAGRDRTYFYSKPKYFTSTLILEIDLTSVQSSKRNTKNYLQSLIENELDSKEWVAVSRSFIQKKKSKIHIFKPQKQAVIYETKNKYEENDSIPNYKKTYVVDKSLLTLMGLQENGLIQDYIRTLNTMIKFYNRDRKLEITKHFSIIEIGRNLHFISYENEFYGIAKLDQFFIYQVVNDMPIYISKTQIFEEVKMEIDNYLCERDNIF